MHPSNKAEKEGRPFTLWPAVADAIVYRSAKMVCVTPGLSVGEPAAKAGTLIKTHSGLYVPDPRGSKHVNE